METLLLYLQCEMVGVRLCVFARAEGRRRRMEWLLAGDRVRWPTQGRLFFSPMAHETTHTVAELNAGAIQQRIRIRSRSSRGNPSPSVRFNFGSLALLPSTRYPICLYRETYEYIYIYVDDTLYTTIQWDFVVVSDVIFVGAVCCLQLRKKKKIE